MGGIMRFSHLQLLVVTLPFIGAVVACSTTETQEPSVADLIQQLGDEDFVVRENATNKLLLRKSIRADLLKATNSSDPERARRARHIVDKLDAVLFNRLWQFRKLELLDCVVEIMCQFEDIPTKPEYWDPVISLGQASRTQGLALGNQGAAVPDRRSTWFRVDAEKGFQECAPIFLTKQPPLPRQGGRAISYIIKDKRLEFNIPVNNSILIASERMDLGNVSSSIVICNGPIRIQSAINCLIVCDGDCVVDICAGDSQIIASGSIRLKEFLQSSRFIAGRKIEKINPRMETRGSVLLENQAVGTGGMLFLDPARFGVTIEPGPQAVRIKNLTARKAFADAGLRVDDLVLALGDHKTDSPDAFRRALRQHFGEDRDVVFSIRRGDQPLNIIVPMDKILPPE